MKPIHLKHLNAHYGQNVRFEDNYGDVAELANNILLKGLIQPLIVEQQGDVYNIISGHRRFAALNLLLNDGKIDENYNVNCLVETYKSEIDRTAAKLLANDGQPLSPDEWAAEIGRLSETGASVVDIAKALGKSEGYVSTLKTAWSKMDENARDVLKKGKVSMSLAIVMGKQTANSKLASLGVQIASIAKDVVAQNGENVSDNVLGKAVIQTTQKLIDKAKFGQTMSGEAIGADVLANIQTVKKAVSASNKARKHVLEASEGKDISSFLDGLIEAMNESPKMGMVKDVLNEVMLSFEQGLSYEETIQSIYTLNKKKPVNQ
jgi:ParB/RepB/Spo0J family partition protein